MARKPTLQDRIRELQWDLECTQTELGERLGVTQPVISALINGQQTAVSRAVSMLLEAEERRMARRKARREQG